MRGQVDRRPDRRGGDARPDPRGDRPLTGWREPGVLPGARPVEPRPAAAAGWDEPADLEKEPLGVPDPAEVEVPADLREEIERHLRLYPDPRSAVLPALMAAQRRHGWCSPEAIAQVAAVMRVTPAFLSSIVTFYDMLSDQPVGRHSLYVCTSVACHLRQAKAVYDAIADEAERRGLEDHEIREFECLGACDLAPMASIDGRYVGPLEPGDAAELVDALVEGRTPLPGRGLGDPDYEYPWGGRP